MLLIFAFVACSSAPPPATPDPVEVVKEAPAKEHKKKSAKKKVKNKTKKPSQRRHAHAVFCQPGHTPMLSCTIESKGKTLEVCKSNTGNFTYFYGKKGAPEITLKNGKAEERALASGTEYDFSFSFDGFTYAAYIVESARAQDNGAGVIVTQDDEQIAQLYCKDDYWSGVSEL